MINRDYCVTMARYNSWQNKQLTGFLEALDPAELTRDLHRPRANIYWPDLLASVLLGYAGLAGAILLAQPWAAIACAVVAVFALYRAESFIHELTHLKHSELPGFRLGWNLLVDTIIGAIPLVGDLFDFAHKANAKNARMLKEHLDKHEAASMKRVGEEPV